MSSWSRNLRPVFVVLVLLNGGCGRVGFDLRLLASDSDEKGGGRGDDATGGSRMDGGTADATDADTGDAGETPNPTCAMDSDSDGTADCVDGCPADGGKVSPGVCGCGVADIDSDYDGIADCIDTCGGNDDSRYVADESCGVGYCQANNTPSSCQGGVEVACEPGLPPSASDSDGVDDDCDGTADED